MVHVVDLSHPLSAETPVHPLDAPVSVIFSLSHASHGMALSSLHLSSHAGTHMDAPYHMLPGAKTLDAYPVSRFVGSAVVLDARGETMELTREQIERAVAAAGGLWSGDFALVWTGWDAFFGSPEMKHHPYLTGEAAGFLRDCGVGLVGVDTPSVDSSLPVRPGKGVEALDLSAHRTLMAADILIVENLRGLGEIAGRRVQCVILPLPTVGAEGSPVRAIAWVED